MHKLHNSLPARAHFLLEADLREVFRLLDQDRSRDLRGAEIRELLEVVLGAGAPEGLLDEAPSSLNFAEFRRLLEDWHRQYPSQHIADTLVAWLRKKRQEEAVGRTRALGGSLPLRRALLVGVTYTGKEQELGGCVHDVRAQMQVLVKWFGFQLSNIQLLTEDQGSAKKAPTAANIRAGLRWLVEGSRPGDMLFFAYSGHGSQVPDHSGEEPDGLNECILPADYFDAPTEDNLILDDELNETLYGSLPEGVQCVCVFDCCHSATMADLACCTAAPTLPSGSAVGASHPAAGRVRYVELEQPPVSAAASTASFFIGDRLAPRALCALDGSAKRQAAAAGLGKVRRMWAFSGCQDNQLSGDATIEGVKQGALTWAFLKALEDASYNLTYEELLAATRLRLRSSGFAQVPALSAVCEADFHLPYLGGSPAGAQAHARGASVKRAVASRGSTLIGDDTAGAHFALAALVSLAVLTFWPLLAYRLGKVAAGLALPCLAVFAAAPPAPRNRARSHGASVALSPRREATSVPLLP